MFTKMETNSLVLNLQDPKTKCIIVFCKLCSIARSEELPPLARNDISALGYSVYQITVSPSFLNYDSFENCKRNVFEIIAGFNNGEIERQVAEYIDRVKSGNITGNDRRQAKYFVQKWGLACFRFDTFFFDHTARVMKTLDLHILQAPQGDMIVPLPSLICKGDRDRRMACTVTSVL